MDGNCNKIRKKNESDFPHYDDDDLNFPWASSTPAMENKRKSRKLNFAKKDFNYNLNKDGNLYPNCDGSVWMRSCETEITEPIQGKTKGVIPKWLKGSLLRNGPGSLKVGDHFFSHLFDSSALLHRFNIENGKVTYQCRFLQSDVFKNNWKANRIILTEFGTRSIPDPCHTIFHRVAAIFTPKSPQSDNSMISLYPFGDEMYAFGEIPQIHKINPRTLETEGKVDVSKNVSIVHNTSHPHITSNGGVYNLGLSITLTGPRHNIVYFPPKNSDSTNSNSKEMFEKASIVAGVPTRWPFHPSYMHTFGITENYFIMVEQPLSLSAVAMATSKLTNEPIAGCFRWFQNEKTLINLICRHTGKLRHKFYAEAFFYLHIINQYEDDDHVILDICIYKDPSMLDCMYVETMKTMQQNPNYAKMFRSRPARFVLPLRPKNIENESNLVELAYTQAQACYFKRDFKDKKIFVKPEKLCDLGCETPRINYDKFSGRKYRFFYAISADVDAENPGTIIKVDTLRKSTKTWCEPNCYPSEPIFVPNPKPKAEDDGVVLASLVWGRSETNRAGLIILDGRNFTEIARAEFETPGPVPKCLHGWFLADK